MNNRSRNGRIILVLAALSLVGVIITQLFWMRNAMVIQEQQCDHRVMVALQSISTTIVAREGTHSYLMPGYRPESGDSTDLSAVHAEALDSLIMDKFCEMGIVRPYYYGYLCKADSHFIAGNYSGHEHELLMSGLYTSFGVSASHPGYQLMVSFEEAEAEFLSEMAFWAVLSVAFTLILVLTFGSTIMALLRQKKMSQVKADFVNNMTHEFKTPISTISVASEMLMTGTVNGDPDKTRRYADIIHHENKRLENMVERVLQIALLERDQYKISPQEIDLHEILETRCDIICTAIYEKGGDLVKTLEAKQSLLVADPMHVVNVVTNLLDNAIKYSPGAPQITVGTQNLNQGIVLTVGDKGVGIRAEHQRQVFKQFFRVDRGDVHDVKGFGLGLYYVKTVVEAHGGYVRLVSEPGKGSEFRVWFPFQPRNQSNVL